MKKRTVTPKKRTVRRRKQQRLKKRQRSLQQRLARLAKAQRPFNSLAAALAKASASAITLVESEKLRQLPRLGKSPLNISTESQNSPHGFRLHSPVLQRPLSLQESLSLPQRLTSTLQVESSVLCRETALLWVVSQRTWQLLTVGCRPSLPECTPLVLTHSGELTLSVANSSSLLASTDSRLVAVEPPAEKRIQKELPLPSFAIGVPAARQTAAYQQAPAAEPKPSSATPVADKPPGAERSSSDDEAEWVSCEVYSRAYRQNQKWKSYKSRRENRPLRKNSGFIGKPFHPAKKLSFQKNFSNVQKNRSCLARSAGHRLRIHGWLPASADLSWRALKLLGKQNPLLKEKVDWRPKGVGRKVYYRQCGSKVIEYSDGRQCGLSESPTANCTDSHRQPFSPAAAAPVYSVPSSILAPTPEDACYNDCVTLRQLIHCIVTKGYFLAQAEAVLGVTMPGYEGMQGIDSYIARYMPPPTPHPLPSS
ncbi:hypothetical protein [unidentified bacterial endosymbiont]|uniref:hypothetical protein n=1 Tax=unidentified bacterial endosymbiont TaxID=2355 RepID=UPI00209D6239|nr:hypothetical protein [unidentified bacterial endosymbiont]